MPFRNLNREQRDAVTANRGYNLVIASAGTGKTSTIVGRIAYLIQSGTKPEKILLLTFTNKAASEMVARVAKFFNADVANRIEAGTFHSISYKFLKKQNLKVTLKAPKELKTLFRSVYDKRSFINFSQESAKPYAHSYLYDIYSLFLNSSHDESFEDWLIEKNEEQEIFIDIYLDILDEFEQLKKDFGYINFNDLLILAKDEFKKANIAFDEVLVDEYQDTNPLQNKLIHSLEPKSLFCVGDYDQSIYAFNGSDISIISNFDKKYLDSNIFTLKKNYRSTKLILDLANEVIKHNPRIYPKELEVVRDNRAISPRLMSFKDVKSQYKLISEKIIESTTKREEIAVIFRNNQTADGVEATLREANIPCKRKGGVSFFEAREVKVFLDLCTILVNPRDMMAFIHIFEYIKGIGSSISKELFDALFLLGDGDILRGVLNPKDIANPFKSKKNFQLGLFDDYFVLEKASRFKNIINDNHFLKNPILKHPKLNADAVKFIYSFYTLFKNLRNSRPIDIIDNIQRSELFFLIQENIATARAMNRNKEINLELKKEAIVKIDGKITILKDISKNYNDLHRFLNALVLTNSEMSEGQGVNLLTVHASKGLEFEEVYVVDLMEGRFPNHKLISKGSSLDEERRLFYVAVTRAKDILYLSFAFYDSIKKIEYKPSCFLYEAKLLS